MMRLSRRLSRTYSGSNYTPSRAQKDPAAERRGLVLILYRNNCTGKNGRKPAPALRIRRFFGWKLQNPSSCGIMGLQDQPKYD